MRIPSARMLLPLVAVVAAMVVIGAVAVARSDRPPEAARQGAGAASAAASQAGAGQPATAVAGDPAGGAATAGLPRVTQAAATTDAVVIWNGRGAVPAATARSERARPGSRPQVQLDLAVTAATGRARAVVRVRNLTATRLALTGTVQLLVTGPGAATVARQRLNRPLPGGATSAVTLPLQPASPGVYRVRAIFVPA